MAFVPQALMISATSAFLATAAYAADANYHPATGTGIDRQGYGEQQVAPDRFLVTFAGDKNTSLDTVKRYVLLRSAELALRQGVETFEVVKLDSKRQTRGSGIFEGLPTSYNGQLSNSWAAWFRPTSTRFSRIDDWAKPVARPVSRYTATAEIVMRKDAVRQGEEQMFNARQMVQSLGPAVARSNQHR